MSRRDSLFGPFVSEEGFLAEIETTEHGPQLRLFHCPLRDLVAVSHLPCQAELDSVSELLGDDLKRVSFMPKGDHDCTYSIGAGSAESEELPSRDPDSTN